MIDYYFRRPILWDYLVATSIGVLLWIFAKRNIILIPDESNLYSIISDLSTISLTLAGFILTLLTVLISFKSSTSPKKNTASQPQSVFEFFFYTSLYFETVKHLKRAIASLTLVAILGYICKLSSKSLPIHALFFYDVIGILVTFFTLWRCLIILSKIIKLQQQN